MGKTLFEKFQEKEIGQKKWPDFKVGDTVKVFQKVKETSGSTAKVSKTAKRAMEAKGEGKGGVVERIQVFEGVVIAKKHGRGLNGTFMVRKISAGVGVEKIFPFYSPRIEKIEIIKRAKVRRAKLYYLRGLRGKKARMKERKFQELISQEEVQEPQEQPQEQSAEKTT